MHFLKLNAVITAASVLQIVIVYEELTQLRNIY